MKKKELKIQNKYQFKDIINTIIFSIVMTLFFFSFSITFALLFRPFYYMHIDLLSLDLISGYSKDQIMSSFNELMDCLCFFKEPFSMGVFKYSIEGMNHFLDCRIYFVLSEVICLISLILIIIYFVLYKKNIIKFIYLKHINPIFICLSIPISIILSLIIYASIDFENAFNFFHSILFPNKDNWIFNVSSDPIINVLPEEVFINYGILIASIFLFLIIILLLHNIIKYIKYKKSLLK